MASLCLCCINGLLENGDVNEIHENGLTTLGNILMRSIDSPEMLQDFTDFHHQKKHNNVKFA